MHLPVITGSVYASPMNQGIVKLQQWMETLGMGRPQLARLLKVTQPAVHRYLHGRVPSPTMMSRIMTVTEGAVTPTDWLTPAEATRSKKKSTVLEAA